MAEVVKRCKMEEQMILRPVEFATRYEVEEVVVVWGSGANIRAILGTLLEMKTCLRLSWSCSNPGIKSSVISRLGVN